MIKPDIPEDEADRLHTLRSLKILDTPPEERFDRLTRLAKSFFDVPIALISLVDENRQWFKSCIGLDALETPREVSFCGHSINGNDVFIVPDASKDKRFSDNPLVTGAPNIRFYAGHPLRHANGSRLGTLCIIDDKPRDLSEQQRAVLVDLALTAEKEIATLQFAIEDELTNFLNRKGFALLGKHSLSLCIRQNIDAVLVFIDLDNLKSINDNYGHAAGDQAISYFAAQIEQVCRASDIFARLGGDEFVVLFTGVSKEQVNTIMQRLKAAVDEKSSDCSHRMKIGFSYGVEQFDSQKHQSIEALIADSDKKMYLAKNKKKALSTDAL